MVFQYIVLLSKPSIYATGNTKLLRASLRTPSYIRSCMYVFTKTDIPTYMYRHATAGPLARDTGYLGLRNPKDYLSAVHQCSLSLFQRQLSAASLLDDLRAKRPAPPDIVLKLLFFFC